MIQTTLRGYGVTFTNSLLSASLSLTRRDNMTLVAKLQGHMSRNSNTLYEVLSKCLVCVCKQIAASTMKAHSCL